MQITEVVWGETKSAVACGVKIAMVWFDIIIQMMSGKKQN